MEPAAKALIGLKCTRVEVLGGGGVAERIGAAKNVEVEAESMVRCVLVCGCEFLIEGETERWRVGGGGCLSFICWGVFGVFGFGFGFGLCESNYG